MNHGVRGRTASVRLAAILCLGLSVGPEAQLDIADGVDIQAEKILEAVVAAESAPALRQLQRPGPNRGVGMWMVIARVTCTFGFGMSSSWDRLL